MKIAIGCDHAGVELKEVLKAHLDEKGLIYEDFGVAKGERGDYPLYGEMVAKSIISGKCDRGILICGTGVGISIAANKLPGIRAVVCSEPYSALLSKQHNNSNILAIGARVVGDGLAITILDAWLSGEFEGGRHASRVDLISDIEKKYMK